MNDGLLSIGFNKNDVFSDRELRYSIYRKIVEFGLNSYEIEIIKFHETIKHIPKDINVYRVKIGNVILGGVSNIDQYKQLEKDILNLYRWKNN